MDELEKRSQNKSLVLIGIILILIAALIGLFLKISNEIFEDETLAFDIAILKYIHQFHTPFLDSFFLTITHCGGVLIVTVVTTLIVAVLLYLRYTIAAVFVAVSVGGAAAINQIMKLLFERMRPDLWQQLVTEPNFSFPSGHAMGSSALALVVVGLLFYYSKSYWRYVALVIGMIYVVLIGVSRLYLGVHYPTDIVGGWLATAAWVGCAAVTLWLYKTSISTRNVAIIYNPKSTRDAHALAKKTKHAIESQANAKKKRLAIELIPTQHQYHAEQITAAYALSRRPVIILSASGDGGYNEVVNGALSHRFSRVITGVLPGGNANDHHASITSGKQIDHIVDGIITRLDVIELNSYVDGSPYRRIAHSYAGIGISARVAGRIDESRPNLIGEKALLLHALFSFRHTTLIVDGQRNHYSSLIFSTVHQMSKVMKLSHVSRPDDGMFEINSIRFKSKLHLFMYAVRASTSGLEPTKTTSKFVCTTVRPTPIQIDGEPLILDGNATLIVRSKRRRLRCVL